MAQGGASGCCGNEASARDEKLDGRLGSGEEVRLVRGKGWGVSELAPPLMKAA